MKNHATAPSPSWTGWTTSSFGQAADTSPGELAALGDHLGRCRSARGRLFALHCAAESMSGFLAARFVTALAIASVLVGISCLVF